MRILNCGSIPSPDKDRTFFETSPRASVTEVLLHVTCWPTKALKIIEKHYQDQQVSKEFAEVMIPMIWLQEVKEISRAAERLSISPE
jgi:hypothetical protein